jgi:hypothetical protein
LVYKDMMVVSRIMVIIAAALLIVASLSLGVVAATTAYGPHPHYSSMDSPDHHDCEDAGNMDVDSHGCCQGISCASSGVLAQVAIAMPIMLLISQPSPGVGDHLYGRSIAPETGPPKLQA